MAALPSWLEHARFVDSPVARAAMAVTAVVVLVWAALAAPPLVVFLFSAGALVLGVFMARPAESIAALLVARIWLDLLWWVDASVAGLNLMEAFSGAVAALVVVQTVAQLRDVQRHPALVTVGVWGLALAVAALLASSPRHAAEGLVRYSSPIFIMLLVTALFRPDRHGKRLLMAIMMAGTVPVATSVYSFLRGEMIDVYRLSYDRLAGFYSGLHTHAHIMALLIGLCMLVWFLTEKPWIRAGLVIYAGAAAVNLYHSHVRTAQLGFVVMTVVFLLLMRRYGLLLTGVVAAVLLVATNSTLQESFADIPEFFVSDPLDVDMKEIGSGRWYIWTHAMGKFLQTPIYSWFLGVGLGDHHPLSPSGHHDSHNDYLTVLFQTGLVGLLAYLSLMAFTLRETLRFRAAARDHTSFVVANYAIAVTAMVIFTNGLSNSYVNRVTPSWLYWTLIGVVFAWRAWLEHQPAEQLPENVVPLAKTSSG